MRIGRGDEERRAEQSRKNVVMASKVGKAFFLEKTVFSAPISLPVFLFFCIITKKRERRILYNAFYGWADTQSIKNSGAWLPIKRTEKRDGMTIEKISFL